MLIYYLSDKGLVRLRKFFIITLFVPNYKPILKYFMHIKKVDSVRPKKKKVDSVINVNFLGIIITILSSMTILCFNIFVVDFSYFNVK
jgi:hypothetical protein